MREQDDAHGRDDADEGSGHSPADGDVGDGQPKVGAAAQNHTAGPTADPDPTAEPEPETEEEWSGAGYRELSGFARVLQLVALVLLPVLGLAFIGRVHTWINLSLFNEQWIGAFLSLSLVATFLTVPATRGAPKRRVAWYDWLLVAAALPAGLYITVRYPDLVMTLGAADTERLIMASLTALMVLEAIRRVSGWTLVVIVGLFVLYGRYGAAIPGTFGAQEIGWGRLMNYLYLDPSSLLWMINLGATFGLAFITFGQVLLKFGAGETLTNLSLLLFGRFRGGSAKAATVGSSLVGTVTGAPMSNVLLTGSVTIPMMIKGGYKRATAGAVEAVVSSGGQIMPPVMGIAAFVIAERLGVPYAEVALAAFLPAVLFYIAVFVQIDLEAGRLRLRRLERAAMPAVRETARKLMFLVVPVVMLVYFLFVERMNAARAATLCALIALPFLLLDRANWQGLGRRVLSTLESAGQLTMTIAAVLAGAGLVVGVISVSGLGFTFGFQLVGIAGESLPVLLVIAAVASIVLGMGMPSVAAYALVAVLVAPALIELGINPMAANLFIFYFAVVSNITPPIALAAFAAAPIAKAKPLKTAFEAMRIGVLAYVIPFIIVFSPELLFIGGPDGTAIALVQAIAGTVVLGIGLAGFLRTNMGLLPRALMIVCGLAILVPATAIDTVFFATVAAAVVAVGLIAHNFVLARRVGSAGASAPMP